MSMGYMNSQFRRVAPARIEQRDTMRHAVLLERVTVRKRRLPAIEAQLSELSAYGCRISTCENFSSGDRISLSLAGSEPIKATTIWCEDGLVGCRFDEVIDRDLFRSLTLGTG
jgi:PilZ domain